MVSAQPSTQAERSRLTVTPAGGSRYARTLWGDAWRRFRRHRLAMAGAVAFLVFTAATLVGPLVYPVGINTIDFRAAMAQPSSAHPFGTNDLGQDMLARVLWGGRVSIAVGIAAMAMAITTGTLVGAIAGDFGRTTRMILMRIGGGLISRPHLPLLLLLIYLFRYRLRPRFGPQVGSCC